MLRQVEGVHEVMEALHLQVEACHRAAMPDLDTRKEKQGGRLLEALEGLGVVDVAWLLEEHMCEIGVLRSYLKSILEEMDDMRVLLQFRLLCSQNKLLRAEVFFLMMDWVQFSLGLVTCTRALTFEHV